MGKPIKQLTTIEKNIVPPRKLATMSHKEATDLIWAMRSFYRQRPSNKTAVPLRKTMANRRNGSDEILDPLYIQLRP
jgi:hypothetical protein